MKPRLLPAALVALLLGLLLALLLVLTARAPALADDGADPTDPASTALPDVDDGAGGKKAPITVGIQTATGAGIDERGRYEYEIPPKGVQQDWVAVFNYSDRPVDVTLLPRDATTTPDSPFAVQANEDEAIDVGSWIAIGDESLRLAPRSRTLVPFQVGVPYNATPGDHVGALVLTVLTAQPDGTDGQQVTVQNRVGLRMYVRVPGTLRPELAVEDLTASFDGGWTTFGQGRNTVDYTVRNTGNVTLSARQVVDLLRSGGLASLTLRPAGITDLLPGGHLDVHEVSGEFFAVGDLTTRVTVQPGVTEDGIHPPAATAQVTQTLVPWGLVGSIAGTVLLAGLLTRGFLHWNRRRPPKVKNPAHRRTGPPTPGGDAAVEPAPDPVGVGSAPTGTEER